MENYHWSCELTLFVFVRGHAAGTIAERGSCRTQFLFSEEDLSTGQEQITRRIAQQSDVHSFKLPQDPRNDAQ